MTHWRETAACRGMDTELFYPVENIGGPQKGRGASGEKERVAFAKKICDGCTVQEECMDYALDYSPDFGIWAGMTPGERRKLGRKVA